MMMWDAIVSASLFRGYTWHPGVLRRSWDVYLCGIRMAATRDAWDDVLVALWLDDGGNRSGVAVRGTTDPGVTSSPRSDGMAVLLEGQYRGSHRLGLHRNDPNRPALVQHGGIRIGRDARRGRDGEWVPGPPQSGMGINIHCPHRDRSAVVAAASEGCQVTWTRSGMEALLHPVRQQAARGMGAVVSYTLFPRIDIPETGVMSSTWGWVQL
jgi:hypothetical protein